MLSGYVRIWRPSSSFSSRTGIGTIQVRYPSDSLSLGRSSDALIIGGLPRAIRMIEEAKSAQGKGNGRVKVDLHPDRPEYRGFSFAGKIISLEADPSFEELESAGAAVDKRADAHTVLDDMFLISGMIPRVVPYETGLKGAVRYDSNTNDWVSDELIADERLLMCNLKGTYVRTPYVLARLAGYAAGVLT